MTLPTSGSVLGVVLCVSRVSLECVCASLECALGLVLCCCLRVTLSVCCISHHHYVPTTTVQVCPSYLCGLCPNDLFGNTKVDEGECTKVHNVALQEKYNEAAKAKDHPQILSAHYQRLKISLTECERRCERAKRRLEDTQLSDPTTASKAHDLGEVLVAIGTRLATLEMSRDEDAEPLSAEEEAKLNSEVTDLKHKRETLDAEFKALLPAVTLLLCVHMRVCV